MVPSAYVRPFAEGDLPQVRWLHDRTPPAGQVSVAPQQWPDELNRIEDCLLALWVAVEHGSGSPKAATDDAEAIVGMVGFERPGAGLSVPPPEFLTFDQRTLRLDLMRVAPERQRRGIGRMLTTTAIEWARANGYDRIALDTTPQQEAAVALYTGCGFVERGRSMIGRYELVWFELVL
jgi:ribosomal protein S18 acetylase RimI-like enzyme